MQPVDKDGVPTNNPNERWYDPVTGRHMQKGISQVLRMNQPVPDSSLLRSPKASDGEGGALGEVLATKRGNTVGVRDNAIDIAALNGLKVSRAEMNMLPTPTAIQARNATSGRQEGSQHHGGTTLHDLVFDGTLKPDSALVTETNLLPTPMANSPMRNSRRSMVTHPDKRSGVALNQALELAAGILPGEFGSWDEVPQNYKSFQPGYLESSELLPTPIVRDYKDGQSPVYRDGVVQTDTLGRAIMNGGEVSLLPTTTASDWKGANHSGSGSASSRGISTVSENLLSWGKFEPAIRRWEAITGHDAPPPTKPDGKDEAHRLSSDFTEWMMGLPAGWITNAGVGRNAELKMAGNGVVPQQAALAIRLLLERITT